MTVANICNARQNQVDCDANIYHAFDRDQHRGNTKRPVLAYFPGTPMGAAGLAISNESQPYNER